MTTAVPSTPVNAPNTGRKVPGKADWAVTPITKGKAVYAFPAEWQGGALHHKISKEKLSSIAEQIAGLYNAGDQGLKTAVRNFWALCWQLAGQPVVEAVMQAEPKTSPHRLLWNLPIMVSLGPKSPATDPGQAFDADTEPAPGGNGLRRMDAVSTSLKALEDAWDTASGARNGQGDFDTALWKRLTALLTEAHAAAEDAHGTARGGKLLYPPLPEQWLHDTVTGQRLRKGLTDYCGTQTGRQLFTAARANVPAIVQYKGSTTRVGTGQHRLTFNGTTIDLVVSVTEDAVHHVCTRHTLTFFDFRATARPINTVWQQARTFADVSQLARAVLPGIARSCLTELAREENANPAVDWLGRDIELDIQPAGPHTVYFRAGVENVQPQGNGHLIEVELKTFAPSGASGPGFLRQELNAIGLAIGALP
ncbi:hypothetical protein [Streptomyces sp. NRRL B-24484]|uniref:hypothetical protein n=1 Tax=Streptomyces sp. NRRL B-24484 TaxID=1463833 RepID=UPI0004C088BC|nr:hypothetical protein [Streptomyces sp. NRRL B-24484]